MIDSSLHNLGGTMGTVGAALWREWETARDTNG